MSESSAFAWLCDEIEQAAGFSRLGARGVAQTDDLCRRRAAVVATRRDERTGAAPDEVFGSLGEH